MKGNPISMRGYGASQRTYDQWCRPQPRVNERDPYGSEGLPGLRFFSAHWSGRREGGFGASGRSHGDSGALSKRRWDTVRQDASLSPLSGRQAPLSGRLPHPYRYRLGSGVSPSKGIVRNQLEPPHFLLVVPTENRGGLRPERRGVGARLYHRRSLSHPRCQQANWFRLLETFLGDTPLHFVHLHPRCSPPRRSPFA